jgi:hypothetical protein
MKAQDFVKYSFPDEVGVLCTYVGKVRGVDSSAGTFVLETSQGWMKFATCDGKVEVLNKEPRGWNIKPIIKPDDSAKPSTTLHQRPKTASQDAKTTSTSRFEDVIKFLDNHPNLIDNRKEAIAAIVATGICKVEGTASVKYNEAKKIIKAR